MWIMKFKLDKQIEYIFNGKLKQISRFSVVGIMNTLIDFIMFSLLNGVIGLNYMLSQVIGYSSGVVNSFIFNKNWTFSGNSHNKKLNKELIKFIIINLISLVITLVAMNILVKNLAINIYVAKIIVTFIAQIINFLTYKLLVFN